jgi:hypothetical protein
MTAQREEDKALMAALETDEGRLDWVQPKVRRINAEGAEQGSTFVTDLGVSYS